jgi:hypothetical protein
MTTSDTDFFAGGPSDPAVVTVYQPSAGAYVTGGGWVHDPSYLDRPVAVSEDHDHGSFGFSVKPRKDGSPSGQSVYTFRGADGYVYQVKSNSWQSGGLAISGRSAVFSGRATVTVVDPVTGTVVSSSGGYTIRVDVYDGSPIDTYAISVYTSNGVLYHRSGTPAEPLALGGGNVLVHP